MNKYLLSFLILGAAILLSGCLMFNRVSYKVILKTKTTGKTIVKTTDIRSDAQNDSDLDVDKENLFEFMYKSDEFIKMMKDEGKDIVDRELYIKNDTLFGKAEYYFNELKNVEGLAYDDGFYYLTLALEDSVISTNGELVVSDDYKRILWGEKIDTLKFEMFSIAFDDDNAYRSLAPYFKSKE